MYQYAIYFSVGLSILVAAAYLSISNQINAMKMVATKYPDMLGEASPEETLKLASKLESLRAKFLPTAIALIIVSFIVAFYCST